MVSAKENPDFGAGAGGAEGVDGFASDDFFGSACSVCCAAFWAALEVPGFLEADCKPAKRDVGFATTWLILTLALGLPDEVVSVDALPSDLAGWVPLAAAAEFFPDTAGDCFDVVLDTEVGFLKVDVAGVVTSRGRLTPLACREARAFVDDGTEVVFFTESKVVELLFSEVVCFDKVSALSRTFCARLLIFSLLLLRSFGKTLFSFVFSSNA